MKLVANIKCAELANCRLDYIVQHSSVQYVRDVLSTREANGCLPNENDTLRTSLLSLLANKWGK